MSDIGFVNNILQMFFLSIFTCYIFMKIINNKNINKITLLLYMLIDIVIAILCTIIKYNTNAAIAMVALYFLLSIANSILTKNKIGHSIIVNAISLSMYYIIIAISSIIGFIIQRVFDINNFTISFLFTVVIQGLLIYSFFKTRRFKNGFMFLQNKHKNDYIDIFVINISIIIMFIVFLSVIPNDNMTMYMVIEFMLVMPIVIIVIQKTLVIYYKQKMIEKTIEQYEKELKEKDEKIEKLSNENFKFVKINHEFYNRQKALSFKVKELLGTEFGAKLGITVDKIDNLTKEYSQTMQNIENVPELPTTNIDELDSMFKYMQSECIKNKIEFNLQVNGNINYLVNNIIPSNKLETLLGDHIRDAIIAVNYNNNEYKNIMVILGVKDNYYQLSIYDTGIEFEINTLINLGLSPITTHADSGGTGIGFVTTFETLEQCKASLIIEEYKPNKTEYTKSVSVYFDGKKEYTIRSYRFNDIKAYDKDNRIIIKE